MAFDLVIHLEGYKLNNTHKKNKGKTKSKGKMMISDTLFRNM